MIYYYITQINKKYIVTVNSVEVGRLPQSELSINALLVSMKEKKSKLTKDV